MKLIIKLLFSGLAMVSSAIVSAGDEPEKSVVYQHLTVIDGTGAEAKPDMTLVIKSGKIVDLKPTKDAHLVAKGTEFVDASGLYVIPGLIDTHVHLATKPDTVAAQRTLRRYLYSGITSVRDMAGDARAITELSRRTLINEIAGPNIYYSALMAGPSFFKDPRPAMSAQGKTPGQVPWMQTITANTDMREVVALARGTSATGIKIYANLPAEEVRRIVAEGRRQGIKVWAHSMVFPASPSEVIDAKVDAISHVCRLAFEISKEKPAEYHHNVVPDYANLDPGHPKIISIFRKMREHGTILDATIWLYQVLEQMREKDPESRPSPVACPTEFAAALTRKAHQAGVDISTGTDGDTPDSEEYPGIYKEIELLVNRVGLTPLEAVHSASFVGARVIGIEGKTGSIQVGKDANLVFLTRDPLENISNLKSIKMTMKDGVIYRRTDFERKTKSQARN